MSYCPSYKLFTKFVQQYKQSVEIDKNKDKKLRYNVWETTAEQVSNLFKDGISALPWNDNNSRHIKNKIEGALKRLDESPESASEFMQEIINSEDGNNIAFSIALHELMESVKGEADKARNLGIEVSKVSNTGVLPALPLSRVAASIGRKVAYQQGYRFKSAEATQDAATEVEALYYAVGKHFLEGLAQKGYVTMDKNLATIKDYIDIGEINKEIVKTDVVTDKVLSVSLNEDKLGITANSVEAKYFLNRTEADITDTKLGTIAEVLRAVRQITQPATLELPDAKATRTLEQLAERDDPNIKIDPETEKARKKLYDTPLYVNSTIHELLMELKKESDRSGQSASQIIREKFNGHPDLINSLFGIKRADDYSIDKKESVAGQNLSKTAPLDDLVDYYDAIQDGNTDPAELHLWLKMGRNARLYYENSVLNPHGSKQSRYMLGTGKYPVDTSSADFDYLVYSVAQALGDKDLTYKDFTGETESKLDAALKVFSNYEAGTTLQKKLAAVSSLSLMFPGVDYVSLLTTMKAVTDIRSPKNGKVTTEFSVSADATASGGTLTFLQALGTNPAVEEFLQRIGILKKADGTVDITLNDLYGVMEESIGKFVRGEVVDNLISQDLSPLATGPRLLMADTVDLLFNKGEDTRELSKGPTMTFVYGQGRKGATETMARSLADRIINSLDDPQTKRYLVRLFNHKDYVNIESSKLKDTKGLYGEIVTELQESGLTGQLYDIMTASITESYLSEYKSRADKTFEFVKKLKAKRSFKILPAAAVLAGIKPTLANLKKYGMPLTKIFEVATPTPFGEDTVLTRRNKLTKTVADVSPIHSMDAAQLYLALNEVMGTSGMVVVHDDVRGRVQDVRAMEEAYRGKTVEVISGFDIHQQIMQAVKAYDPELAESAEFKTLENEINETVTQKKAIITSPQFNADTHALIGDGLAYTVFAKGDKKTPAGKKAKTEKAPSRHAPVDALPLLKELAGDSSIITKFLSMKNKGAVELGNTNAFIPETDTVVISGTDIGRGAGDALDITKPADRKLQVELIEHEIVHANTVAQITKALGDTASAEYTDMRYFDRAIDQITKYLQKVPPEKLNNLPKDLVGRMWYITGKTDPAERLAEFVAIMKTESDVSAEMYAILGKVSSTDMKSRIQAFIKKVLSVFEAITAADFEKDVDVEKLYGAIERTIAAGETLREQNYAETDRYLSRFKQTFNAGATTTPPKQGNGLYGGISYLNYAVASMLNSRIEREGQRLGKNLHQLMKTTFPMYTDVADKLAGIYDDSPALQQILHSITGNGVDKTKKADILAKFATVMAQQTSTMNDQMGKFNKLLAPLSKKEKATIGRFVTEMPLHDYFVLASELTTEAAIAAEVVKLEAEIKKVSSSAVREVNELIEWNVLYKEDTKGRLYNLAAGSTQQAGKIGESVRKLLALKSIQAIGAKDFEKLLENTELANLIKDNSVANKLSLTENAGETRLSDSLVMDYYKEPFAIETITLSELGRYKNGESTGWNILKVPTGTELGIVYKKIIDSTSILGAYTDIKLNATGVEVSKDKAKYPGVVKTTDGFKFRLTRQQKLDLGLVEDFSQSLVKSTVHNMAIQDSQIIRNELLRKDTRLILGQDHQGLLDTIKSENVDNPWFIKLEEGVLYSKLPAEIRAKYMEVGNRASNVENFNENVDLVRKDISHWLLGDSSSSLFQNPKMKWAMRILKDAIAGAKIGMVVMNPVKILNDNISNIAYLGVMGASPLFIAKNYKDITRDFQEYSDLQRQIIQLKVQATANPESQKIKKQLKSLRDRANKTPVGDIQQKGFINSLGSDLVAKNADTLTGLQADMHTALEYLLINKEGKKNYVSHFIMQLQNLGFNGEDFLTYIGRMAKKASTHGEGAQKELDMVAERLKEIRTEEDIVNYVSQYTNSPGSEAVRLGASITDLTDVLAKETFYRHLVQVEGMNPEAARIHVLDSFPDYKENMPLSIKHLSDMGIIMFPSFWLRIQKVIYRMAKDKPINLATELVMEEVLNNNINTIMDANIINKSNSFGGLFHTPVDSVGVGSVIPMHIW